MGYLYHYTNYDALKYILPGRSILGKKGIKNKDTEFRFTRYDFLNDCNEGEILYEYLKKQRENICKRLKEKMGNDFSEQQFDEYVESSKLFDSFIEEKYSKCFAFCVSRLRDSSQFWLSPYANEKNGGGICLCFDSYRIGKEIEDYIVKCVEQNEFLYQSIVDYVDPYEINSRDAISDENLNKLEYAIKNQAVITDNFCVKYAGWKSEQEFRWLYRPNAQSIQYDNDDKQTPRARLYFNCITDEIILGPSFKKSDINYVQKELESRGYGQIKISLSKVQLRR